MQQYRCIEDEDSFAATRARASAFARFERFAETRHRGSLDARLTQIGVAMLSAHFKKRSRRSVKVHRLSHFSCLRRK